MNDGPESRIVRRSDGTFAPGQSPNPGGITGEDAEKVRQVRRYALQHSLEATDKILEVMRTEDDNKVSLAAAIAVLKLAGAFNDKATTDDALVARINELAAQERARRAAGG